MTPNRDKNLLFPPFAQRLVTFESRIAVARLPFFLFMGFRTFEEQDELHAQGRTTAGPPCMHKGILRPIGSCSQHPLGLIVTNARGGDSFHCYGFAGDYVLDGDAGKPGVQWSWDIKADMDADGRIDWVQMGSLAVACGLEWAGHWTNFPEFPHVQYRWGHMIKDAKTLYREGGLPLVWQTAEQWIEETVWP